MEEGLNIVKEAQDIGGEDHDEYSANSSSEWKKLLRSVKCAKINL